MRSFHLLIMALVALVSAGPIPQTPVAAAASPVRPAASALPAASTATTTPAVPAAPATTAQTQDAAPGPIQFDFGGSSQYSQQELRRRQRKFLEQLGTFQKSPYGSGAVPVPENSAESGFGGSTLF